MRDIPVVIGFIAACVVMYVLEKSSGDWLTVWLALWPLNTRIVTDIGTIGFSPWQLVSYAFLHGGELHLFLNLYALWMFGAPLERRWGSAQFAGYLLGCIVGAAIIQLIVAAIQIGSGSPPYPVIGASGGVFGLLLAFGYLFPNQQLLLLFPPMPIKARWFVIAYGVIELLAGLTGSASGIAHFAHLGGMLAGYLLIRSSRALR